MKILHLSDNDIYGGAARATYRLHRALLELDIDSHMLVRSKASYDKTVLSIMQLLRNRFAKHQMQICRRIDNYPLRFYRKRLVSPWGIGWFPNPVSNQVAKISPDLVNLHWVSNGFLPIRALSRIKHPLVWLLHDSWPFTGGCHIPYECTRYRQACGDCPQLCSHRENDISRWIHNQRRKHWHGIDLTIVAPSSWLADCARASTLFRNLRIEVIPNGLDLLRFRPVNRGQAREWLGLPLDRHLILFGAPRIHDPVKGFRHLQDALHRLVADGWAQRADLVTFGEIDGCISDIGLKAHHYGLIRDDISLALLYASADVMVVPSLQEAFGQTATEAMACGTPVVAFRTAGLLDIVEHERTGYLAQPYRVEDLAKGIVWVLEDEKRRTILANQSRKRAENKFDMRLQAQRYAELYRELLARQLLEG